MPFLVRLDRIESPQVDLEASSDVDSERSDLEWRSGPFPGVLLIGMLQVWGTWSPGL